MGFSANGLDSIEWRISDGPVDYPEAVATMDERVLAIRAGQAPEMIWLLEHPPLYTAGTSARDSDLLTRERFPVHRTGRGGQFTYHGPGQRIAYVMLDLRRRGSDVHAYVRWLEQWIIDGLARLGIRGERREGRVGIWIDRGPGVAGQRREDKIAAIGVRVRHWVTLHGLAINVDCDLDHFAGIVPCGIAQSGFGVTSIRDLGLKFRMEQLDAALRQSLD